MYLLVLGPPYAASLIMHYAWKYETCAVNKTILLNKTRRGHRMTSLYVHRNDERNWLSPVLKTENNFITFLN